MHIPPISTEIVIIVVLGAAALYGMLSGKQRLRVLILSTYVGIVLAEQLSAVIRPYLGSLRPEHVSWILLVLPMLLFGFSRPGSVRSHADKGATIANIIVGILAGGLIVSSAIHMLPSGQGATITNGSFLAAWLQQYHLWLVGLLPIVALVLGFMKSDKHK